jgi:hypothetical protein
MHFSFLKASIAGILHIFYAMPAGMSRVNQKGNLTANRKLFRIFYYTLEDIYFTGQRIFPLEYR